MTFLSYGALFALNLAPQGGVEVHEDVQYSEDARQSRRNRLDLFVPDAATPPPVVMFVHGGSWTGGSKDYFGHIGETLAAQGFACAVINTRLFPFAKPDVMVGDCARALGFVHRHGEQYGYDGDQLFVMGHSSGAHLCSWLAYDERQLAAVEVPRYALRGAVLLSGVYDVRGHHVLLDGVFGRDDALRRLASTWFTPAGGTARPTSPGPSARSRACLCAGSCSVTSCVRRGSRCRPASTRAEATRTTSSRWGRRRTWSPRRWSRS